MPPRWETINVVWDTEIGVSIRLRKRGETREVISSWVNGLGENRERI